MAIERIQKDIFEQSGFGAGQYAFYAKEVESQFLPSFFTTLEEYGLPVPVALKLERMGLRGDTLDELLTQLRRVAAHPAVVEIPDPFEQEMLAEVVTGLGPV